MISSLFEVLEALTLCKIDKSKLKRSEEQSMAEHQQSFSKGLNGEYFVVININKNLSSSESLPSLDSVKLIPDSIVAEELDAIVILEWLATLVFSTDTTLKRYWPLINAFMKILLEDNIDIISIRCPYFLERCTVIIIKATIQNIQHSRAVLQKLDISPIGFDSIWISLKLMRAMPSEVVCNISDQLGAGICYLIKVSHENSICMNVDHWYMIFSILSAATSGANGRPYVWQSVVYLMENNLINDMNYTPCRHLILRFLQNAFPGEIEDESRYSGEGLKKINYWTISAINYITRLMLMALFGYSKQLSIQTSLRSDEPPNKSDVSKISKDRSNMMSFASHDDPKRLTSSPKYSQVKSNLNDRHQFSLPLLKKSQILNSIKCTDLPVADPNILSKGLIDQDQKENSLHITVSSISFANQEEVELLWLETCKLLSDMRNASSLESSIKAIYCSEIILHAGKNVNIPFDLQLKALHEMISRLPLSFQLIANFSNNSHGKSALPNLPEFIYCSLYSCNLVFDVFVANITELRKAPDFPVVFIRFIGTLATNMSILNNLKLMISNQHQISEEIFDMVESLLRLLRIPIISITSPHSNQTKVDSKNSSSSSSYFAILNWIFQEEEYSNSQPNEHIQKKTSEETDPKFMESPSKWINEEHDGNLLSLSWRTVTNIFPSFSLVLKSRNPTLCSEILRFVENYSSSHPSGVSSASVHPPAPITVATSSTIPGRSLNKTDDSTLVDPKYSSPIKSSIPTTGPSDFKTPEPSSSNSNTTIGKRMKTPTTTSFANSQVPIRSPNVQIV